MRSNSVFAIILFTCVLSHAQVHYRIVGDKKISEVAGAEFNLFSHRLFYSLEDRVLKPKWTSENNVPEKILGIFFRFGKSFIIDYNIDYFFFLNQHERYGHGARLREFGFKDNSYSCIVFPPPFGDGAGYAFFGNSGNRKISIDESLGIRFGGTEANAVMTNSLRMKWLQKKEMNYRESILYFHISLDLLWYIMFDYDIGSGSDIVNYLDTLDVKIKHDFGQLYRGSYNRALNKLQKEVLVNIADPYFFLSVWTYARTYLLKGETDFKFPMINVGTFKYLPSFRLGLTPFGTEFYFDNYFSKNDRSYYFYMRHGEKGYYTFNGLGIIGDNLLGNKKLKLNVNGNIWDQPGLAIGGDNITNTVGGIGGALTTTLAHPISKKFSGHKNLWRLNIVGQFGYKTPGYLQGESFDKSPILRIGLGFSEEIVENKMQD